MTETTGNLTNAPGWYPNPAGTPRQRWWDGARWTQLYDPRLEVYGTIRPSILGPETPVYNGYIWTITLVPVLSIVGIMFLDLTGSMKASMEASLSQTTPPATSADLGIFLLNVLSFVLYGFSVLLSNCDRRRLLRDGFARPFHWAWSFLGSPVYIIGRSIIVNQRAGRGLTPIWAYIALTVLSLIVVIAKMVEMMAVLLPLLEAKTTQY